MQGEELPQSVINNYPLEQPGKYNDTSVYSGVHLYGTQCAPWDLVPGTPFHAYCDKTTHADWTSAKNWCTTAWCYVLPSCPNSRTSDVFNGSTTAHYSYETCGAVNCYTDPNAKGCPNGGSNGKPSLGGECDCKYAYPGAYPHGLPPYLWMNSTHATKKNTRFYGTTCNAWDSVPETPWGSFCGARANESALDLDWCDSRNNWCEVPWCYVSPKCPSSYQSDVFPTEPLYYSYNACNKAPRCYGDIHEEGCPFDKHDTHWYTRKRCGAHYSDCACQYQGASLPQSIITGFPTDSPGKHAAKEFVHLYGTSCVAWDSTPGTPWEDSCANVTTAQLKTADKAWCSGLWCYVGASCYAVTNC